MQKVDLAVALEDQIKPNNYIGTAAWRFGPCMAGRVELAPEYPVFQTFFDNDLVGKERNTLRPLPVWNLRPEQRFMVHLPFNLNLASQQFDQSGTLQNMLALLAGKPASAVLHIGAKGHISTVAKRINNIYIPPANNDVMPRKLLLEPPAGEQGKLGGNWDELRRLCEMLDSSKSIGLCLDTCHLFGSGMCAFDNPDEVIRMLGYASGLAKVGLIHLNDSETPLNSHRDLHAPVTRGHIWGHNKSQESLRTLLQMCHEVGVDIVTETGVSNFQWQAHYCGSMIGQ